MRGDYVESTIISEIETLVGKNTHENVLEGFRANTEYLCDDKPCNNISNNFLNRCNDDLMIIDNLSEFES